MDIIIALITVVIVTIIFYKFLDYVSVNEKINRIEPSIVERETKIKIRPKVKKKIIKVTNYYYTLLFAIAAFITFYISNLLLAIFLSVIVFMTGFGLGYLLIRKYGKEITAK